MTPDSSAATTNHPNFLVIVMDAVSVEDFAACVASGPGMPCLRTFAKEAIRFPFAVAPAPWTVPSFASLLTGLYPTGHGAHGRANLKLASTIPTLPEMLRPSGYRSALFSANPALGPPFGLMRGFDFVQWAWGWETLVRLPRRHGAGRVWRLGDPEPDVLPGFPGPVRRLGYEIPPLMLRHAWLADALTEVAQRVATSEVRAAIPPPSPWLEAGVSRWLEALPTSAPALCVIDFMDAHEPYLADGNLVKGFRDWARFAGRPQGRARLMEMLARGDGLDDVRYLRDLYRAAIRGMDSRIQELFSAFQRNGRWENSLTILTSDHGQAFGQNGQVYHMRSVAEPVARVPLWLRLPGGDRGDSETPTWASLVDIVPTLLEAAGMVDATGGEGESLRRLAETRRESPVFVMNDGHIVRREKRRDSSEAPSADAEPTVAGYQGSWKLVVRPELDRTNAFNVQEDPEEQNDLWPRERVRLEQLSRDVREKAEPLFRGSAARLDADQVARLRSWGYVE